MENDARVALVGEENATSKKLMISAVNGQMVVLTRDINGVHLVRINTFLLKLPIFYLSLISFQSHLRCKFQFKGFSSGISLNSPFWVSSERIQDNTFLYKYSSSLSGPAISNTYIKRDHTMERTNQKCMTLTAVEDSSPQYISNSAKCARGSGSVNYEGTAFVLCMTNETPTTTSTTTTSTTSASVTTTTSSIAISEEWGPIAGANLPKMPCISALNNSHASSGNIPTLKKKRETSEKEKTEKGRFQNKYTNISL